MQRDVWFFIANIIITICLSFALVVFGPRIHDWWAAKNRNAARKRVAALRKLLEPVNFEEQLFRMLGHLSVALWLLLVNLGADLLVFPPLVFPTARPEGIADRFFFALPLCLDVVVWGAYLLWIGTEFRELYQRHSTSEQHARFISRIQRRIERLDAKVSST